MSRAFWCRAWRETLLTEHCHHYVAYMAKINSVYPFINESWFGSSWIKLYEQPGSNHPYWNVLTFLLIVAIGQGCSNRPTHESAETKIENSADQLYRLVGTLFDKGPSAASVEAVRVLLLHVSSRHDGRIPFLVLICAGKVVYLLHRGKGSLAWTMCGRAIRVAQAVGLHRRSPRDFGLTEEAIQMRTQTWWVAFSFDAWVPWIFPSS